VNPYINRWWVLAIFALSSAINYLDRQSLASLAPLLRDEFRISNTGYGLVVAAFSATYAASAPFAGLLIDRIGLTRGATLAVGVWSLAGIATGFARGLPGLLCCRAVLGLAEAGGIPAVGKAIARYLPGPERALGNSINQAAVSFGAILAPPVATFLAVRFNWRMAFVLTGAAGLLWILAWHWTARHAEPVETKTSGAERALDLVRDHRLWGFVAANALSMVIYSLWSNWTTLFLVEARGRTLVQAAWIAWIPPVFATLGGFAGGWLSLEWIRQGRQALAARRRVCLVSSLAALITAAVPLMPGPGWAAAAISLSIFSVAAFSVNLYTMPLDAFGPARAAFAISLLVSAYGMMQALVAPVMGRAIDLYGYAPVCGAASLTPIAAYAVLAATK
jgi:MFS transporter, ACS family, hexuronate transporter